jgi:uncharacterized membrane protein
MQTLSSAKSCATALVLALPILANANRYTIVDLGALHQGQAINDNRAVATSGNRPGLWKNGHWKPLGDSGGAYAINGHGDVAGELDVGPYKPYVWPRKGPGYPVILPHKSILGTVYGIAHDRTVVGTYLDQSSIYSGNYHCFIAGQDGVAQDMGLPVNGYFCQALDVNGAHQVAINAIIADGQGARGFIWQDGQFVQLPALPGTTGAEVSGLNMYGDAVGGSGSHATLWKNGEAVDIGGDPRYVSSWAYDISDAGYIVGGARLQNATTDSAVRFERGQIYDLTSEIDNLDDWQMLLAVSVNNDGVIAGTGIRNWYYHGKVKLRRHAFMLVPVAAP